MLLYMGRLWPLLCGGDKVLVGRGRFIQSGCGRDNVVKDKFPNTEYFHVEM